MKRKDLIRELTASGCHLYRHGARHDVYWNPHTARKAPVPRHAEIPATLCKLIKKQLGIGG